MPQLEAQVMNQFLRFVIFCDGGSFSTLGLVGVSLLNYFCQRPKKSAFSFIQVVQTTRQHKIPFINVCIFESFQAKIM